MPFESVLRSCGPEISWLLGSDDSCHKLYLVFIFVFYVETHHLRLATWMWTEVLQWIFPWFCFRPQISNSRLFFKSKHNHGPSERWLACRILQLFSLRLVRLRIYCVLVTKSVTIHSQERKQISHENNRLGDCCWYTGQARGLITILGQVRLLEECWWPGIEDVWKRMFIFCATASRAVFSKRYGCLG